MQSAKAVEKALIEENLGFFPRIDGNAVEVTIPPMTKELRENAIKQLKKAGELTKENLRQVRQEEMKNLKQFQKTIPKDDFFKYQKALQEVIDEYVASVDTLLETKEKEMMTA